MTRLICNKKAATTDVLSISFFAAKLISITVGILLSFSTSLATQSASSGPDAAFLNSPLAIKTETGRSNLSIRLVEFLMGIQTNKRWERKSDNQWVLKTAYRDPVIDKDKAYVMEFERVDRLTVLSAVSLDNRQFSYPDLRSFADCIIQNFVKHVSPK